MKVVNLYDLKQMGNKGGCTIQLIHHFPPFLTNSIP
ncbi:Tn5253 bacteriocine putative [Streptococcus pneumoniae]|nr:Tn5253 bacteriocine putative [Streptococcus pneumoniae]